MKRYIPFVKSDPFVAVIRLQGAIANSGRGLDNPSQSLQGEPGTHGTVVIPCTVITQEIAAFV